MIHHYDEGIYAHEEMVQSHRIDLRDSQDPLSPLQEQSHEQSTITESSAVSGVNKKAKQKLKKLYKMQKAHGKLLLELVLKQN